MILLFLFSLSLVARDEVYLSFGARDCEKTHALSCRTRVTYSVQEQPSFQPWLGCTAAEWGASRRGNWFVNPEGERELIIRYQ